MLSARDVGIVAQRELSRNLRSTKGIAMFVLFFLGGLVPAMIRFFLRRAAGDVPDEAVRAQFQAYLKGSTGTTRSPSTSPTRRPCSTSSSRAR